jgi:hypothetical protein
MTSQIGAGVMKTITELLDLAGYIIGTQLMVDGGALLR